MSARSEEIKEEADYVNAAARTVEKTGSTSDQKFPSFTKSLPPLAVCWFTLLIIMSLRIYFTSVMSENNTKLTVENQGLTAQIHQLETQNQELETQNQQLETQKNNLTEKIQDMETKWNQFNVNPAQWSIDTYCPRKNDNRQCKPCQDGWSHSQTSCFAINNPYLYRWKTWDEARKVCKGEISSDLAVIVNQEEKTFINDKDWRSLGTRGYWIGLRAEDGKWKWVDGTDLTETSWMQHPATDGHCAISDQYQGWISVNCSDKNMWICGMKALTI